eukprot:CAMPEP_0178561012 /NCGR_PEP_ID=MMETSP0697-20121206/11784_1 /TAXON_ID=265572 /ORGANISM="Extubocellulus spinifer, Strain CCMP396" /LENGTH=194 /DNA_ID=CAMNT_0020194289 /DNA_START=325 /DNA_END=906 /DNA_ORIENTATION=+
MEGPYGVNDLPSHDEMMQWMDDARERIERAAANEAAAAAESAEAAAAATDAELQKDYPEVAEMVRKEVERIKMRLAYEEDEGDSAPKRSGQGPTSTDGISAPGALRKYANPGADVPRLVLDLDLHHKGREITCIERLRTVWHGGFAALWSDLLGAGVGSTSTSTSSTSTSDSSSTTSSDSEADSCETNSSDRRD